MTYRTTKLSYILWLIYALVCIVLLALGGNLWLERLTGLSGFANAGLFVVSAMGALLLSVALYLLLARCAAWCVRRFTWKKGAVAAVECLAFLLVMAGALLVRIMCLNAVSGAAVRVGDAAVFYGKSGDYFARAIVTANGGAMTDYSAGGLYAALLTVTCSFLGNRAVSAVFLQIVLQMAGLLLLYAATRKLAGRLPAWIAAGCLALSPACLRMLVCLGPEWLFFDLYLLGLYLTGSFAGSYCENRMPKPAALLGAVAVGALIGVLACLELTALSLLLVVLFILFAQKSRRDEAEAYRSTPGMSVAVILTAVLACAAAWCGGSMLCAFVSRGKFGGLSALGQQIEDRLTACYENSYLIALQEPYAADRYLAGLLVMAALFLVYAVVRNGSLRNDTLWVLMTLLMAPTPLAVCGEYGFGILSLYLWAVLAGLGLQNSLFGGSRQVMKTMIEQINGDAERAETAEAPAPGTEEDVSKTENGGNSAPKTAYIENPLPLPKKHVKRDMEYQYDVPEQDMRYDIEIAPDDDFDIQ